ncbi:transcription factor HHO2-like [Salvia divinorum]|uniref:Transcription factor HHO2-like n=1 Tax=Salvia divinorum TaxID=28513 RepID=A0ABD1FSP5_SALDI
MGSLIHSELGQDSRFSPKPWFPKPIGRFLADVSQIRCVSDKILKLDDYLNRLLDEMKKIDAFKRELPLCMLLISEAIVVTQEELAEYKKLNSAPVLEEFIQKICTDDRDDKAEDSEGKDVSSRDKKNWMSSVQLWNSDDQNTDYKSKKMSTNADNNRTESLGDEIIQPVADDLFESGKNRGFVPFKGSPNLSVMEVGRKEMDELPVPGLSLCTPGINNSREVINPIGSCNSRTSSHATSNLQPGCKASGQMQTSRKQRRCWSPELHRQFINTLQHLGGPEAATPKQIREHMQVDGLTNDEVKSHLQKYRLHMRRVATKSTSQSFGTWASQDQFGESLKQSNSQSGSPEGPLHLSRVSGEDEDDE